MTNDQRPLEGISFVVPIRNGVRLIGDTLGAIAAQADDRPLELLVVDDGSTDGSAELVVQLARALDAAIPVRLLRCHGGGAAAAINAGIVAARYPIVCQVDQDVRVQPEWMRTLAGALADPSIGAAQGWYATDPRAPLSSRVMGLDLEQRYQAIAGDTDHVCTGNTAYRTEALRRVGLFDESMGYGYDNDMSYRLRGAGYGLAICPGARAFHRWREGLFGYLAQQYGLGYGRLDVVARHRRRLTGDRVSPLPMMAHPIVMLLAVTLFAASAAAAAVDLPGRALFAMGAALVSLLALERLRAGSRAVRQFGDRAAWLFPIFHLLRDLAWVAAMLVWTIRRAGRRPGRPSHSMLPRPTAPAIEPGRGYPRRAWSRGSPLQID